MWEENRGSSNYLFRGRADREREEKRRCEISHLSTAVLFPLVQFSKFCCGMKILHRQFQKEIACKFSVVWFPK